MKKNMIPQSLQFAKIINDKLIIRSYFCYQLIAIKQIIWRFVIKMSKKEKKNFTECGGKIY